MLDIDFLEMKNLLELRDEHYTEMTRFEYARNVTLSRKRNCNHIASNDEHRLIDFLLLYNIDMYILKVKTKDNETRICKVSSSVDYFYAVFIH